MACTSSRPFEGLVFEGIDRISHSTMHRWWAKNQEATLKDLAYQAQSLLVLKAGRLNTAEKEGQWKEVVRRSTKGPEGKSHATLL